MIKGIEDMVNVCGGTATLDRISIEIKPYEDITFDRLIFHMERKTGELYYYGLSIDKHSLYNHKLIKGETYEHS